MLRGIQALLDGADHANAGERLQRIWSVVERRLQGRAALDDIALMMVKCRKKPESEADAGMSQTLARGAAAMLQREVVAEALQQAEEMDWQVELKLAAAQLHKTDVIPVLMLMVNNMETQSPTLSSSLFVTLSELFNNALDHGVLEMDSALKQDPAGMELYFEERALRLKNLDHGEIDIRMEKFTAGTNAFLKVTFKDSGQGFDYVTRLDLCTQADSVLLHGRGIMLMQNLCYSLRFMGKGNEVEAILLL